jgi:hypothetical protein
MRRATALTISAVLAVPAAAHGKGAIVQWDRYPESVKVGDSVGFTIMMTPMRGMRPLVTFRSDSGRTVRVRASRADLNGIAYARVAFPDKGPWSTEVRAGRISTGTPDGQPIRVGVGLTQTIPAADASKPGPIAQRDDGGGVPWAWVLSIAGVGSALLVLTMRRRGRWGAA